MTRERRSYYVNSVTYSVTCRACGTNWEGPEDFAGSMDFLDAHHDATAHTEYRSAVVRDVELL